MIKFENLKSQIEILLNFNWLVNWGVQSGLERSFVKLACALLKLKKFIYGMQKLLILVLSYTRHPYFFLL